jgi:hypothetical protein
MGGIGVFGLELRHPGLRLVTSCDRFNARDESAFFDDQLVVYWCGKGKRHDARIPHGTLSHHAKWCFVASL